MSWPLLAQATPEIGDSTGCRQMLLGPGSGLQSGAPAVLLNLDDRRTGGGRLALFVELSAEAAGKLMAAGRPCPPKWPLLARTGPRSVVWDGLTSVPGAQGVTIRQQVVSWVPDRAGTHVCVLAGRDRNPDWLLEPLRSAGVVWGWADRDGHERRWLADNVQRVAPAVQPPGAASASELRAGLTALAGFASVPAMAATGGYQPAPEVAPGGVVLARVRTTWRPRLLAEGRASIRVGPHASGPGSLAAVLVEGHLASVRARRLTGAPLAGWAAHTDIASGTAGLIELEVDPVSAPLMPPPALVWTDPGRLLDRLDAQATAVPPPIPTSPGEWTSSQTVWGDPSGRVLDMPGTRFPSLLVTGTVGLYGRYGPDEVVVRSDVERHATVRLLEQLGIDRLQSRWVADAVVVHPTLAGV